MVWAAVIGAIAGGVANAVATYKNDMNLSKAYSAAADTYRNATEEYSGQNEYRKLQNAADIFGNAVQQQDLNSASSQGIDPYHMSQKNRYNEGANLGQGLQSTLDNARFNKETAAAQNALKQAGVDYAVNNQTQQAVMNTAGGLADLYKNTKRSE